LELEIINKSSYNLLNWYWFGLYLAF